MSKSLMKRALKILSKLAILTPALRKLFGRKQVLVACFPKSGSTFISTKISELPGFSKVSLVPSCGRRDQHVEGWSLFASLSSVNNICAQQHCRADENSIKLLNMYNFKVVILTRPLIDVAVSLSDHWDNVGAGGPRAYLNHELLRDIDSLGYGARLKFIVKHHLPWYISFYVSWKMHYNDIKMGSIFLNYDSFFREKDNSFRRLIDFIYGGDEARFLDLDAILAIKSKDRFNKGVSGRGVDAFRNNPDAYRDLLALLSFYPNIDFSPIFTPIDMEGVVS